MKPTAILNIFIVYEIYYPCASRTFCPRTICTVARQTSKFDTINLPWCVKKCRRSGSHCAQQRTNTMLIRRCGWLQGSVGPDVSERSATERSSGASRSQRAIKVETYARPSDERLNLQSGMSTSSYLQQQLLSEDFRIRKMKSERGRTPHGNTSLPNAFCPSFRFLNVNPFTILLPR